MERNASLIVRGCHAGRRRNNRCSHYSRLCLLCGGARMGRISNAGFATSIERGSAPEDGGAGSSTAIKLAHNARSLARNPSLPISGQMVTVPWSSHCSNGFTVDGELERANTV